MGNKNAVIRFRAKVANFGFRGQRWEQDDIVEVSPEEAEVIPHHFEQLGVSDDGSDDPKVLEQIQENERLDGIQRDRAMIKHYDRVKPVLRGGAATAVAINPEDSLSEARARKEEQDELDAQLGRTPAKVAKAGEKPEALTPTEAADAQRRAAMTVDEAEAADKEEPVKRPAARKAGKRK